MDMSDPRWPSLREAARRFLREDGCTLSVPVGLEKDAWEIVQMIADHVPSKLELPKVVNGELAIVGIAQIGGLEPPLEICWVPNCGWSEFSEQVLELLEAGYPGCIGCGGPGAEEEWNEEVRRGLFLA
jgi:hypothetical protein